MKREKYQESRRDFIKTSGWITATALTSSLPAFAQPERLALEHGGKGGAGKRLQTTEWIARYAELKVRMTEKRKEAGGVPVEPVRKKFGEKASSFSIDLRGVETLFLSAARGNQEGQWDYAVWGNARLTAHGGKSVWLDELPFQYERTGHDSAPKMRVNDKGEPIRVAGKVYEHAIFCFADSLLAYPVKGEYERFEAEIGVEDLSPEKGAVLFSASNIDATLVAKDFYRSSPEQAGALYAASMEEGKNMEALLLMPDASIERRIVKKVLEKLKGDLSEYRAQLEKAERETGLKNRLVAYLSLFERLRSAYSEQRRRESKFSFAFLTDVHLYENNARGSADGFGRVLEQVKMRDPDFLLFGGDNVPIDHYKPGDERAEALMKTFKAMVDENGQKAYYAAGNHDLVFTNGSLDPQSLRSYEKVFGPAYHSFTHKGVHFIVLNSNEQDGKGVYRMGEEQIAWLKEDLKATGTDVPIVLSMHVPMLSLYYPVIEGRYVTSDGMFSNYKEVWDLIRDYSVKLLLQGHQHVYEEIYARKTQFVTGGAVCDNWWLGGGFGDTFSGYLMVYVDHDDRFTWEYICF